MARPRKRELLCRKFETSRRREILTFAHHAEVAALPPDEADAFLDWACRPDSPFSKAIDRALF